ncbi:hypothetical protein EDD38_3272 [Kitasatospora cineracea]|uniref:LPXTG-motif cell wall-anchored protein n=1 Tax=Kitasatospora cineracea TaxID=88074 RepID=A0A3N4S8C1_9ACTN|nr:hypothetical protein EDD38_3272 [Kitasatospora cineracea]
MAKLSRVLRWLGVLFVLAAGVQAFTSAGDGCGSVVQPDPLRSKAACEVPLADQRETVWLLGGVGVVLGAAGQVVNWRQRRARA